MNMHTVNQFIEKNLGALARDCQSLDAAETHRKPWRLDELTRLCSESTKMNKKAAEQFAVMLVRNACVVRIADGE